MTCRKGCGACCIVPSIASRIPGMPQGKPADVRCVHLDVQYLCDLYEHPDRPVFCHSFTPSEDLCGTSREDALGHLAKLEELTRPKFVW